MHALKVGRPPRPGWRRPADLRVTVLTDAPVRVQGTDIVVLTPDLTDIEQALTALHRHRVTDIDVVHTDFESSIVMAAALAGALGARIAIGPDLAVLARDKYLQKCAVAAAGVPVTDIEVIPQDPLARSAYRPSFPYPVVLKPALGAGTVDVHRVDSPDQLDRVVKRISGVAAYVCERFVPGDEIHVDGILQDGELRFLSVGKYLRNTIQVQAGKPFGSIILPQPGHEDLYAAAERLTVAVMSTLGHSDGSFHLEAFVQDGRLTFSECGLRHGGAKGPDAIALASGEDVRELSFLAGIGCLPEIEIEVDRPRRPAGVCLLAAGRGRLISVPTEEHLLAIPGVRTAYVDRDRVGKYLDAPTALSSIGYCVFTGDSVAAVRTTCGRVLELAEASVRSEP